MYDIRIYEKRDDITLDYCEGSAGVKKRVICQTPESLVRNWWYYLKEYEGDAYSIWANGELLISGSYDPGDLATIKDSIKFEKEDNK